MTEGEGLLKEAKELLWGWHLPPVIGVGMGGVEMDQLGKCSKAIEVSRPHLSLASYPMNLLAHIYVSLPILAYVSYVHTFQTVHWVMRWGGWRGVHMQSQT